MEQATAAEIAVLAAAATRTATARTLSPTAGTGITPRAAAAAATMAVVNGLAGRQSEHTPNPRNTL